MGLESLFSWFENNFSCLISGNAKYDYDEEEERRPLTHLPPSPPPEVEKDPSLKYSSFLDEIEKTISEKNLSMTAWNSQIDDSIKSIEKDLDSVVEQESKELLNGQKNTLVATKKNNEIIWTQWRTEQVETINRLNKERMGILLGEYDVKK